MGTVGRPTQWIVSALIVTVVAGMVGSIAFEEGDDMQRILYSMTAIAGVIAGLLLAVRHARGRLDFSASGFGALAVLSVAGGVAGYSGGGANEVFASLAVLHWPALWLVAAQSWSPVWARGAAAVSGLVFALWGYSYVLGDDLAADVDSPLLYVAYLALTVATVGWIMTLQAEGDDPAATTPTHQL